MGESKKNKKRRQTKRQKRKKRKQTRKKRGSENKEKNNTFKKDICVISSKKKELKFTCYNAETLNKIKNIWNARHSDIKIQSEEPMGIWKELKKYTTNTCNRESCWLKHQCIKNDIDKSIFENTFAPSQPVEWKKNPNTWLSSIEISQLMKQYEKAYQCFEFLGPTPIDFDTYKMYGECVWEELCNFSLQNNISRGKFKVGIIFNLDKHDKKGSHWMAGFIDIKKGKLYFMDSYGEKLPGRIKTFFERIQKQGESIGKKMEISEVTKRQQFSESECGMYSLYFIIELLKDKPFSHFNNDKIPDWKMRKLRSKFFNKK